MHDHAAALRYSSTRRDIVLLLKKLGAASIQQMSEQLELTGMAVRRHLIALQKEKYVRISKQCEHVGVGRPSFVYQLTIAAEQLFPHQYDILATELMDEIDQLFGEDYINQLFEQRRNRIERKYETAMLGRGFEERIATLAAIQDKEGYMVTLEKNLDGSYSFEEANCPVSQVALRYRQACACELALFGSLLDADVKRMQCIADGDTKCLYQFTKRDT
ncbi:metalloregulator ArsR/SmtB family transcription factor [Paenibacillus sp. UMB4589-SE434]|uniref:helix-turn-helix transcriptional regulator n=1 Tax=Paenibacillus sp. UMB4589-SE434 TaxID=3046314 RepID=UPI00254E9E92|nr:metalloregulator ArsR/SmtB family transcription factor [Paenibacillus sp. UMB4589-SE434]MDK8179831.1 transcriptional regulator [Paenibacillus sp. UMB4589-SE434]